MPIFDEKNSDNTNTYLGATKARLGASSGGSILLTVILTIALITAMFYVNFKAMGLAVNATGPIVKHGVAYTFFQPFYSLWAIYYVFLGHKKA